VTEVAITSNIIQGRMKVAGDSSEQGQPFRTIRVTRSSPIFCRPQCPVQGGNRIHLRAHLFSWIFPIVLFVGIWFFMMKRMQGQQPGFMSLGKNKAKIYMEDEVGVRFEDVAGVDDPKGAQGGHRVLKSRSASAGRRKMPRGVLLVGRRAPEKPCSPRPWPARAGALFQHERLGVRRDVRRPGRRPVRDLFTQAKAKRPASSSSTSWTPGQGPRHRRMGGHDEREQTLNQLLVEMDGFDPR